MTSIPLAALLFLAPAAVPPAQSPAPAPVAAVEYSDQYHLRAKVHKIASLATLPLAGAEFYLGNKLYNDGGEGVKSAHVGVATGLGVLFGANTLTGVPNLWASRHDPNGRTKRIVHGVLMLAADAGFFATAMLAPGGHDGGRSNASSTLSNDRSRHRNVALLSIGTGTLGYLIMLLGK